MFLHNYFKNLVTKFNVILPGGLSVLCNTVKMDYFLQNLRKTARKSIHKIERLAIFLEFFFLTCHIMQMSQS